MSAESTRRISPWVVFAITATGIFITTLDLSIVNVAFAEIAKSYPKISRAGISWIVTAYNILFASLLVASGRTADRVGRKRLFQIGITIFAIGSALCAFAPTFAIVVAGRAIQGIGGAVLSPATLGLLLTAFPPERRTQIVSLWGGIGALGVATGPTLGALMISTFGWRSAFWVNLPICAVAIIAGRRYLTETAVQRSEHRPDYLGAAMVTVALASLALGLSEGGNWGWTSIRIISCFVVAVAIVPVFLARQNVHPEPVLDLRLFDERTFSVANVASVVFGMAFAAMLLNNVLFLRTVWRYSVLEAGMASFISPVTVAITSGFAGKLAGRIGFRPLLLFGPCMFATVGILEATQLRAQHQLFVWLVLMVALGISIGCTFPVLNASAVSKLPPARFAIGGAVNNTARQIGAVLGIALLVAVQGTPTSPQSAAASFHRGWVFAAVCSLLAALTCTQLPRRAQA